METFKTQFQAHRYAKNYFASLLNISPKSIRVIRDTYYDSSHSKCECGECYLIYFEMKNAGVMQQRKLQCFINRAGSVIALSVCKDCGMNYGISN